MSKMETPNKIEKNFYILSFNYKHLPLEVREAFIKNGYKNIIEQYKLEKKILGYVAVETCLRIELYIEIGENFDLNEMKQDFKVEKVKIYNGNEAIYYLLRVICGLESIIKGEDQILAQLKKAYISHMEKNKTSSVLNIIFNQAVETGKRFRNESKINEKNISLDSIAVKFLKSKMGNLENKNIFIIGVGDLSQSILALLYKIKNCNLTITNRSDHKSMEIQKIFSGTKTAEYNKKYEVVKESDIIISATSAPHLILEENKMYEILYDNRHRVFLDLAVPRDIDVEIKKYKNIELYHLENIWEEYNKNVEKRDELVKKYFYIIDEQLHKIREKLDKRQKYIR